MAAVPEVLSLLRLAAPVVGANTCTFLLCTSVLNIDRYEHKNGIDHPGQLF